MKRFWKVFKIASITVLSITIINFALITTALAAPSVSTLISLANSSRSEKGLASLTPNSKLESAATAKANDMLAKDYFSHNSPDGKTPWDFIKGSGYSYVYAGENLAIGFEDSSELHSAWMNSQSHRENILNPNFRDIGIAVVTGEYEGSQTTIVVQEFGSQVGSDEIQAPEVQSSQTSTEDNNSQPDTSQNSNNQPDANNQSPKSFEIDKSRTGFEPAKIFSGESVDFIVGLTGEVKDITITVGLKKINLIENSQIQEIDGKKIYEKRVQIDEVGDLKITLLASDKNGNQENFEMGKLTVAPKVITKNSTSGKSEFWTVQNLDRNKYFLIFASILLVAIIGISIKIALKSQKSRKMLLSFR